MIRKAAGEIAIPLGDYANSVARGPAAAIVSHMIPIKVRKKCRD
jgi:hypothetical protein